MIGSDPKPMSDMNESSPSARTPRIVAERGDRAPVVAVGSVCIVVDPHAVDGTGRYTVPPDELQVIVLAALLARPGFTRCDKTVSSRLLTAEHIAEMSYRSDTFEESLL
ncbi:hypothetical protein ACFYO7_30060 [Nocardia salmonicida]|uniref:hypothetical protein n=1 Tax=Nocardia salmonicida TaxID=53431 RepID=UPI0036CBFF9D